ncbi:IS30 family transposase [Arthrobacter sp. UYP6]
MYSSGRRTLTSCARSLPGIMNGLLRQDFPKGTDLSRWSAEDLEAVALTLNSRPRKILGWRTPTEVFEEQIRSVQETSVATTI